MNEAQQQILSCLENISSKLDDVRAAVSALESRTVALEVWREASWPVQAELVRSIEERLRAVEREQQALARLDEVESKLDDFAEVKFEVARMREWEPSLLEIDKIGSKLKLTISVLGFLAGAAGTVITKMLSG